MDGLFHFFHTIKYKVKESRISTTAYFLKITFMSLVIATFALLVHYVVTERVS